MTLIQNLKRRLNQIPVSKQTAGTIGVSNVVSVVSDSDPFLDASQVFKYELDNNTLDTDQVTPIDGTPTNITYDYEGQKFGTAQAVFDGATSKILGTASIASNAFTYSMVVTPDIVDVSYKYVFAITTGLGILSNGSITNENLWFRDSVAWIDLGYKLTVGKQETIGISVNGTSLDLYIDGIFVSNHTITLTSIDGVFSIGSDVTGTVNFFKGKIDQPEVYNRGLTATEMEALYFQEITRTDNLITTTDVEVSYHNGYNLGAVNTAEALTNLGRTVTLSASAWNWLYTVEGSDVLTATPYEPVYGKNNKRTVAGYNPDIIDEGFTFSSSNGGEKVVNGENLIDTTGWTASEATGGTASTISAVNGELEITNTGATYGSAYQQLTGLTVGKEYKIKVKSTSGTSTLRALILNYNDTIASTAFLNTIISNEVDSTLIVTFTAEQTSMYIVLFNSNTLDGTGLYGEISLFETDIEKDTAYVTPRTYLNTKIEADSAGKPAVASEWIGASLVERRGVFENLEVSGDLETKGEFIGKNACTAWVNFDGTTTPPTIKDSFNVVDVVKISTGEYDIVFKKQMDNEDYSVASSCTQVAIASTRGGSVLGVLEKAVSKVRVHSRLGASATANGEPADLDIEDIQIFGGKK